MSTGTDDNPAGKPGTGFAAFASREDLRAAFEAGLRRMLATDSLGGFILVLANAGFEPELGRRLAGPLREAFARWCALADAGESRYRDAAADDRDVFERLRAIGPDHIGATRWRRCGPWELQFNPLRALRPPRMSGAVVDRLRRDFDPAGFHFDKPFLRDEILWEGSFDDVPLRLLFNKFPFAESHALLVPAPAEARPQYLAAADHALAWQLSGRLAGGLPGIGFGYNAYGAFASVNHLHLQMFERRHGSYPVEAEGWQHNGGDRPYPLPVRRFEECDAAWATIERLQDADRAFNLLYRPGRLYLLERAKQGHYRHSDWTGGFAWSEVAGAVTVFREDDFERLDAAAIEVELGRMALRP